MISFIQISSPKPNCHIPRPCGISLCFIKVKEEVALEQAVKAPNLLTMLAVILIVTVPKDWMMIY
jgi:hypothetical protein